MSIEEDILNGKELEVRQPNPFSMLLKRMSVNVSSSITLCDPMPVSPTTKARTRLRWLGDDIEYTNNCPEKEIECLHGD